MNASAAARILLDEHLAIASVLYSLSHAVRRSRDYGATPDFGLLRALIDYIVEFPERLHHPKETQLLFPVIVERVPAAAALVADLDADHAKGKPMIEALQAGLERWGADPAGLAPFADAVEAYTEFHTRHMSKEDDQLMPLAQQHLTDDDWNRIGEAFRDNDNPSVGVKPKERLETLYRRILSFEPEPIGGGASATILRNSA